MSPPPKPVSAADRFFIPTDAIGRYNPIVTEITLKLDEKLAAELTEASQENGTGLEDTVRSMIEKALRIRRSHRTDDDDLAAGALKATVNSLPAEDFSDWKS